VNLLIYLADQLLRGCQSANNQFPALQNQEIKGCSVHSSRLPELEAEVVQIQLLVRISLKSDVQFPKVLGFDTWRISVPLFWATCKLFSILLLFWILESFFLWILLLCLPLYF